MTKVGAAAPQCTNPDCMCRIPRKRMSRAEAAVFIRSEVAKHGVWTREAVRVRVEAPIGAAAAAAAANEGLRIYNQRKTR